MKALSILSFAINLVCIPNLRAVQSDKRRNGAALAKKKEASSTARREAPIANGKQ